jgi:CheY-like chemotaxis protein
MDLRILIVDDSETTRRILRAIVRSRAWTVCGEAESGRSGIKQFQELRPDLVLIDLAMPDINGIEAAKRMSTLNPRVPLLLFTILDLEGLEKAMLRSGCETSATTVDRPAPSEPALRGVFSSLADVL